MSQETTTTQCYGGPQDGNMVHVQPGQTEVIFRVPFKAVKKGAKDDGWLAIYKVTRMKSGASRLIFDGYRQ